MEHWIWYLVAGYGLAQLTHIAVSLMYIASNAENIAVELRLIRSALDKNS